MKKMLTWLFSNKELTLYVGGTILVIFLWGYYLPKQDCIANISIYSDDYLYPYGGSHDNKDAAKRFKTRNEALDYCMAQRWDF